MWEIIKAIIVIAVSFISIGVVFTNLGYLLFKTFTRNGSKTGLSLVNLCFYIIGAFLFTLIGMLLASMTEIIGTNSPNKYTIGIMAFFMLVITYSAYQTRQQTKAKAENAEFLDETSLRQYRSFSYKFNLKVYSQLYFIPLSFIFFVVFHKSADNFSFGLYSLLKNFVSN